MARLDYDGAAASAGRREVRRRSGGLPHGVGPHPALRRSKRPLDKPPRPGGNIGVAALLRRKDERC
jgi:hypothetical protein